MLNAKEALPRSLSILFKLKNKKTTVIIDCFLLLWCSFKADSSEFVYVNQPVNKSCSVLCRLLTTLLNLEASLSQWEILKWCIRESVSVCVLVHLCVKYRKQRIIFVLKSQDPSA